MHVYNYECVFWCGYGNRRHPGPDHSSIHLPTPLTVYRPPAEQRVLPCFHKFHVACIDEWLARKKLCPLCNTSIDVIMRPPEAFLEEQEQGQQQQQQAPGGGGGEARAMHA